MRVQRGSALVETMILAGVFIPMLFGMALLGKYIDVKSATLEASRYAVWERTVWADAAGGWHEGENQKSEVRVAEEVNAFVMGHPSAVVDPGALSTANPLWVDRKQTKLLKGMPLTDEEGRTKIVSSSATVRSTEPPASGSLVNRFAFGPLPVDGIGAASDSVGGRLGDLGSGCGVGLDLRHGLNLGKNNFATSSVAVPVRNFLPPDGPDLNFRSTAAILSNSWTAPDAETFRRRVDNLTVDELVECAVLPGQLFAAISLGPNKPLYGEGLASYPVVEALDDQALPTERKK